MKTRKQALVFFTLVLFALSGVHAQQDVSFETQKVAENVYCLYGSGGNIGILSTDEGLLIVDSQFESVADSVLKKIGEISSKPIRYLVNTHYHGDHTGGNEIIGKGAEVIMHPDCRATKQHALDQAGVKSDVMERAEDWEEGMVLQLGDETVHLLHFGDAHTSGDIVLVFEDSKVVHTGDLFFHGRPPYIDVEDGADAGVVEGGSGTGLALEALPGLVAREQPLGEELERHLPTEAGVLSLADDTHPPAPELLEDAVVGDRLADHDDSLRRAVRRP